MDLARIKFIMSHINNRYLTLIVIIVTDLIFLALEVCRALYKKAHALNKKIRILWKLQSDNFKASMIALRLCSILCGCTPYLEVGLFTLRLGSLTLGLCSLSWGWALWPWGFAPYLEVELFDLEALLLTLRLGSLPWGFAPYLEVGLFTLRLCS